MGVVDSSGAITMDGHSRAGEGTDASADDPISVGLVGTGSLGISLGDQFRQLPETDLEAVADVDERSLEAAGDDLEITAESRYADFETMVAEEPLDAVAIVTPNGRHYEQVCTALAHDLHVLCEKPLATTVEDAYDLLERSEASDRVVMVGYQRHCNPAFIAARERWALGDAEPTVLTGEITHDWRSYFGGADADDWRMDPDLSGGGHLLNVGTHVIDAMLWVSGLTPTHVTATVDFHDRVANIDRQSSITLEFAEGVIATVSDTGIVARTREHIHIWDDDGAIYLEGEDWGARTGYVIESDGSEHPIPTDDREYTGKAASFVESILEGTTPPATVHDGFRATLVTMAAYESGRRNERVDLRELYPFVDEAALGPDYSVQ